jgi:hypothetical protein
VSGALNIQDTLPENILLKEKVKLSRYRPKHALGVPID